MSECVAVYCGAMQVIGYAGGAMAIVLSYAVLFFLGPAATDDWVAEDRIVETVSALSLLAASIFFLLILINGRRHHRFGKFKQVVLTGLVILFFFGAGEEISWGQRYLGLKTPTALESENAQQELNLHNLNEFSGLLNFDHLAQLFWVVFGVVLPVAAGVSRRARFTLDRLVPVLPFWVAVYLVFNQIVAWCANVFNNAYPYLYEGRYYTFGAGRFEVTETIVSTLFAAGACALYLRMKVSPDTSTPGMANPASSARRPAPSRPEGEASSAIGEEHGNPEPNEARPTL